MLGFSLKEPKDRPKEEPDGSSFTLAFSIINGYGNIYLRRMSLIADFQEMEFPMTSLIRTGLLALVIIVVGAYSIASQAAEPLVGSWRLVSWVEVETESKSVHAPFGDNPSGMITYTTEVTCPCLSLIQNVSRQRVLKQPMLRRMDFIER